MLHILFIIACVAILGVCTRQIWRDSRSPTLEDRDIDARLYELDPEFAIELGYEPPKPRPTQAACWKPRAGEMIYLPDRHEYVNVDALRRQLALAQYTPSPLEQTLRAQMAQGMQNGDFARLMATQIQQQRALESQRTRSGAFGSLTGGALGSIFPH